MKLISIVAMVFILAAPSPSRAETSEDFLAFIEAELEDLSRFRLSSDPAQVSPRGPKDEPGKLYRILGWMTYGTSAADVITTEVILARGGGELNPLMRNRAVRIGSRSVFCVAFNKSTEYLRTKKGHPKIALWMRISIVALHGYVVARNVHVARGLEP